MVPIRVGLVGTGYTARIRAAALLSDDRSHLVSVAGRSVERTSDFAMRYGLKPVESWQALVVDEAIDLVIVATVSALHGDVAEAALRAGKHVVVEYPLSLNLAQAKRLSGLAASQNLLLHVEHIELLGGLHREMRSHLPNIGNPGYVNYRTLTPRHPAPMKWTYQQDLFGFPFCGALSRVHRLTNLFGRVSQVDCCLRMVDNVVDKTFYSSVLALGRLQFESGVVAALTYGKGERIWTADRTMEVQGSEGCLSFVGNQGTLTTATGTQQIAVAPRKGLLAQDTAAVLAYLDAGVPLYVSTAESLYASIVADALRRAAERGQTVCLSVAS